MSVTARRLALVRLVDMGVNGRRRPGLGLVGMGVVAARHHRLALGRVDGVVLDVGCHIVHKVEGMA